MTVRIVSGLQTWVLGGYPAHDYICKLLEVREACREISSNRGGKEMRSTQAFLPTKPPMLAMNYVMLAAGAVALALMLGAIGCSTTQQEQPNIIEKVQGVNNPVPAFSGFLGDYSYLQRGGEGQALYRYVAPGVDWAQYKSVIIDPVTFWGAQDSSVSPEVQQELTAYFYNKLHESMAKYFTVVDAPGPSVMRLQVAITDASSAIPVLRTASVLIPQMRVVGRLKELVTGSFAFVGSARGEMKLTDSVSGAILAEALDQQMGGNAIKTAATWQWQDAERAMDHWCDLMATRLNELHTTGAITTAAS